MSLDRNAANASRRTNVPARHPRTSRPNRGLRIYESASRWIRSVRQHNGCAICGSRDGLHFHHKDTRQKAFELGEPQGQSMDAIIAEMRKCVVLCAAHHRHVHAADRSIGPARKPRNAAIKHPTRHRFFLDAASGPRHDRPSDIRGISCHSPCRFGRR